MDWLDYREKLGIGFCDSSKFCYFKTILFNYLRGMMEAPNYVQLSSVEYADFCNLTGNEIDYDLFRFDGLSQRFFYCVKVIDTHASCMKKLLSYYVALINSVSQESSRINRELLVNVLSVSLNKSHIPYDIHTYNGEYYAFPKGIAEFDDALVSEPLEWLKYYSEAEKAWSKALREYADKDKEKSSDVADLFRKALEAFFQEFFAGRKSLENYKSDYGSYLKAHGVPSSIANNFEALLQAYTNFMNDCAKHRDATSDKVLEYLMYQTGNIMRLLITLKQGEQQDAD